MPFLISVLLLAPQQAATEPGTGEKAVVIATSKSLTATLLILAAQNNFFKKQGVNVRLKYYPSAGKGFKAMLNGETDISAVAETPVMHAGLLGSDFKIFATLMSTTNDPKIIFHSDIQWTGKPEDIAGETIGTTRSGQSAHFFVYLFLLKYGISLNDVKVVHGPPERIIEKLSNGEIRAASLFEPHAALAANRLKNSAYTVREPGLYSKTYNLVSGTSFLIENKKKVIKILRALFVAEAYFYNHQYELIPMLENEFNIGRDIIEEYFKWSTFEIHLATSLITSLHEEARWALQYGLAKTKKSPDYSHYIFPWYLKAVHPERVQIVPGIMGTEQ